MFTIFKKRYKNKLIKSLSDLPYFSEEYEKVLRKIQKMERNMYGNQHILCIDIDLLNNFNHQTITDLFGDKYDKLCENLLINNFDYSNHDTIYAPRYKVEYDFRYKQVLTFGYITSKTKDLYVFLEKTKSKNLGLVGGHTDFHFTAYGKKPGEYLIDNLIKEILEEIKIYDKRNSTYITTKEDLLNKIKIYPKAFVDDNSTEYTLRNVAFIYKIEIQEDELFENYEFYSNELDEHSTCFITFDQLKNNIEYYEKYKRGCNDIMRFLPEIISRFDV